MICSWVFSSLKDKLLVDPSRKPIVRYVTPEENEHLKDWIFWTMLTLVILKI